VLLRGDRVHRHQAGHIAGEERPGDAEQGMALGQLGREGAVLEGAIAVIGRGVDARQAIAVRAIAEDRQAHQRVARHHEQGQHHEGPDEHAPKERGRMEPQHTGRYRSKVAGMNTPGPPIRPRAPYRAISYTASCTPSTPSSASFAAWMLFASCTLMRRVPAFSYTL